ncbi:hypothetical protein EHE19_012915 [Ruminiclostridium herbifermentans]|uniref:Uncharacterized protein n=1 Tax=Ruminiclostridium herbifermentans TaxID=2488810 RepID=A0A4U7JDY6_9FIRM|nr:hypothetical protein [Ruminiclostridium herbifermentans]QNU65800.1 hypothetical protein EHE19_012915 [Ruminiclostridium herbifermentans]
MKEQIQKRINELKEQLESGSKMIEEMEVKRTNLTYTLLRINGAIQVLEELLIKEETVNNPDKE